MLDAVARIDEELALKSFEVACRVVLRGRVGVENGELKVGVHGTHLNGGEHRRGTPAWYCRLNMMSAR